MGLMMKMSLVNSCLNSPNHGAVFENIVLISEFVYTYIYGMYFRLNLKVNVVLFAL